MLYILVFDLPSKKSSLQKIFGSNLTLQKRAAFGIAQNHWLSLASAKEKIPKTDSALIMVSLLNQVRTHFSKNQGL